MTDPIRVLIVDDDAFTRSGVESLVSSVSDLTVVGTCSDGTQVADAVRDLYPDVVLCDVRMPVMDGIAVVAALSDSGPSFLMMTAMDVASLPPALVRSGRIELWLETRLPDAAARTALLTDLCAKLPASLGRVDIEQLVAATEQLSGADLKRVVEDGKLLYAFVRAKGTPKASVTDYFIDALATVRGNKMRYAEAEARARSRQPTSANQIMRHRAHSVLMSHTVGLMTATSDDS